MNELQNLKNILKHRGTETQREKNSLCLCASVFQISFIFRWLGMKNIEK